MIEPLCNEEYTSIVSESEIIIKYFLLSYYGYADGF